jgi:hypothetical protein
VDDIGRHLKELKNLIVRRKFKTALEFQGGFEFSRLFCFSHYQLSHIIFSRSAPSETAAIGVLRS